MIPYFNYGRKSLFLFWPFMLKKNSTREIGVKEFNLIQMVNIPSVVKWHKGDNAFISIGKFNMTC